MKFNSKMKAKIFFIIIIFFFLFAVYLFLPTKCLIQRINNNNKNDFITCFTPTQLKSEIKQKLSFSKLLYNFAGKIKIIFFTDWAKNRNLDYSPSKNFKETKKYFIAIKDNIYLSDTEEINFLSSQYNKEYLNNINFNQWYRSTSNNWNNHFYETEIINKKNIKDLKLKWIFNSNPNKDAKWRENIQSSPVYAESIIYFLSSDWSLNAINIQNGKLLWKFNFSEQPSRRGFLWHKNSKKNESFILITSGEYLFKINSKNGELIKNFGINGSKFVGKVYVAPVIYKNQIILADILKQTISSYDVENGGKNFEKLIHDNENNKHYSTPWSGSALDSEYGIFYITTGNPKPSLYGVNRPGENLNSNSLIAFDLNKQKIKWSFQETIHDLWDYDLSSQPVLANINFKNKLLKVVIVTTKIGNTFVFERITGKSLFNIKYKEVPISNVTGEVTSKFQINNDIPENFSPQDFQIKDIRSELFNNDKFMKNITQKSIYGKKFIPPTIGKTLINYGIHGGSNWHGKSLDTKKNLLFILNNRIPYKIRLNLRSTESENEIYFDKKNKEILKIYKNLCSNCHQNNRNGILTSNKERELKYIPSLVGLTLPDYKNLNNLKQFKNLSTEHKNLNLSKNDINQFEELFTYWDKKLIEQDLIFYNGSWLKYIAEDGYPINNPPWGEIVAINIEKGNIVWKSPIGYLNYKNQYKRWGDMVNGGLVSTSSGIIFATGTNDKYIIALNASNGEELWKYKMNSAGSVAPIISEFEGKIYISVVSTGLSYFNSKNKGFELYTFSID